MSPLPSSSALARSKTASAASLSGTRWPARTSLHALARDTPFPRLTVNLHRSRSPHLPGSRRRQDQEPEAKFGRLVRFRPVHGFKRRRYFVVRQRPEVRLDGRHGRQGALDSFPGHVLLDVAMRPAPPQHGTLSLLEAVSGRTIRDCERVGHSRRQTAASSALVSRSRAMPTGGRRSKPSPRFFALGTTRFPPPAPHLT